MTRETFCSVAGWLLFLAALAAPFLMPPGKINGGAIVALAAVFAAAALITRGRPALGGEHR